MFSFFFITFLLIKPRDLFELEVILDMRTLTLRSADISSPRYLALPHGAEAGSWLMYKGKQRRPRTNPWGTPEVTCDSQDQNCFYRIFLQRLRIKNENQKLKACQSTGKLSANVTTIH